MPVTFTNAAELIRDAAQSEAERLLAAAQKGVESSAPDWPDFIAATPQRHQSATVTGQGEIGVAWRAYGDADRSEERLATYADYFAESVRDEVVQHIEDA